MTYGVASGPDYEMPAAIHHIYKKAVAELDRLIELQIVEGKGPKSPYP
jgi:hypothetical protein